ncbi:MAG TPA: molybdopterin-binding protein, partial [Longimicrobiaceae bacterium]|nr:molybdopterin-binding protein [Longimicrobiaceae bacterium]
MPSESSDSHHAAAAGRGPVPVAVVTVSDTRTPETDTNAAFLRERIAAAGHVLAGYRLIRDAPEQVRGALEEMAAGEARVVVFNGGTGISPRDTTY